MATYQEIAAGIRSDIQAGRLRPGDRVPSARQITRDWGVAIATASRALAQLRADGLVRGVVGVGTVVAAPADRPLQTQPRREPRRVETELTRERIVRTAVAIADAEGMAALTMRRLATELDVAVMSLYRHVPGKEDLALLMADHVLAEAVPPEPGQGWRAQVEAVARLQWAVMKRHPWVASVTSLTRPLLVPKGMALMDRSMAVLRSLGFDPPTALQIDVVLAGFLSGIGMSLQLEVDAQRETGLTSREWAAQQAPAFDEITRSALPALAEIGAYPDFDLELDDVFELGLALLLDGLQRRIPRAPGAQKRVSSSRSMPRRAS